MATETTRWAIDPTHSVIGFKVKHLVISTVKGTFKEFSGQLESKGEDFDGASATFEASIDSIDTGVEDRDAHLKSADFFDAENHPKLMFKSTTFKKSGEGEYDLEGELTIRGTTKTVQLKATHGGTAVDPYGQTKAGFEIEGTINRKEFGLEWNAVTEAGNIVVADKIHLNLDVQVTQEA
ncbi:MAG: YceI family protein [Balneolaceae bacterium]